MADLQSVLTCISEPHNRFRAVHRSGKGAADAIPLTCTCPESLVSKSSCRKLAVLVSHETRTKEVDSSFFKSRPIPRTGPSWRLTWHLNDTYRALQGIILEIFCTAELAFASNKKSNRPEEVCRPPAGHIQVISSSVGSAWEYDFPKYRGY